MTVAEVSRDLARGRVTSRELVEQALQRITDPAGEGAATFITTFAQSARAAADKSDRSRKRGVVPSPLAGIPISIKDLIDVAGARTTAGSAVFADGAPARADAAVVARLRAAGAIVIGKTNLTEFAFGAEGFNAVFGDARNAWDRATGRIPGGSSTGAAISVTDDMAVVAIGSDTGGSIRIPAALNGIAGFKPTQNRIPVTDCFPLAPSLDSIGPLGHSVTCCALTDAVMAGTRPVAPRPLRATSLSLLLPSNFVLDGLDPEVGAAFGAAVRRLRRLDVHVERRRVAALDMYGGIQARYPGWIAVPEAYAVHRDLIAAHADRYEPSILRRIEMGRQVSAADYIRGMMLRRDFIAAFDHDARRYDAIVMPAVPIVAPRIDETKALSDIAPRTRLHLTLIRNPVLANYLDGCSVTIPCHRPGAAPVGFMLIGRHGADAHLLNVARTVEMLLAAA